MSAITNYLYGLNISTIKAKGAASEALKDAMEESVKFAALNQYGSEKAIIDWQTCASDVLDVLGRKQRAAGADC